MVRVWVILGKVLFCRVGLGFNHGDLVPGWAKTVKTYIIMSQIPDEWRYEYRRAISTCP